jgi:hypothetical protein
MTKEVQYIWVKGAYKGVYTEMRNDGPWSKLEIEEYDLDKGRIEDTGLALDREEES